MLNKVCIFFLLLLIPGICISQKTNRFKNKERHGKWIIYHDTIPDAVIASIGRYRNGNQRGLWKYYDENGRIEKTEKFRFKKIHTTVYYPNGKIKKAGNAKQVKENNLLHFYYYGDWLVYDSLGTLVAKEVYKDGNKISEINYKPVALRAKGVNDSVDLAIKNIDSGLRLYFDTVDLAKKTFGENSYEYKRAISLNNLHTSKLLTDLDKIISQYGYPGKSLVGDDYAIAFSIISSANKQYKEKYLALITNAADKGELDWTDVAFFVDKVKVSKKEKQIYCTQYIIDEQKGKVYFYPVEDPAKLNERRNKAGIGEIDLSEIEFTAY